MTHLTYKIITHRFGPGETIHAIIRKYNHLSMTKVMLEKLMQEFNELNNNAIPHPGEEFKIPIFVGFLGIAELDPKFKQ